ncbi:MAG: HAMP domain-containing sensor histidine kinase [Lentimicrobiaceae bacterium]|nr:HAMP domain-containing sensor histidine kinase [Lentimicrobiaceae bacterium]
MKLLNRSLQYLSLSMLLIVSIWSVVFYLDMMDEIYDSIDDGLDNYKLLIQNKAEQDSTVLLKNSFDESNYAIRPLSESVAFKIYDVYKDTMIYMPFEEDMEPVRLLTSAFEHKGKYYELKVISSMVEEDDLMKSLLQHMVWLYILLIVCIIIINNVVLKKLWLPFYNLLQQFKDFRLGKDSGLTEVKTNINEFEELQIAGQALISHSVEAYNRQKQFTENAAHELQTPLAIISGKIELLLERDTLSEQAAETLSEVLQISERMNQLNKSLLLLSKIENKQFYNNQDISLTKLVKQGVDEFEDFVEFRNLSIDIRESGEVHLHMDVVLAGILVSNLLKNALYHNIERGEVIIEMNENKLHICNTSASVELNGNVIFNRFYKSDAGRQGTGLGLAILKAIVQLYGFKITYSYKNAMHCFEITFR